MHTKGTQNTATGRLLITRLTSSYCSHSARSVCVNLALGFWQG